MREGVNPAKHLDRLPHYDRHRVIIPVFIPDLTGFFEESLTILQWCLQSLHRTMSEGTAITVVANGCVPEVLRQLELYRSEGWIDQLVVNRVNHGKVDSLLACARGCFEPLLTFADCDVLFRSGWMEAVEEIFRIFPECGCASPVPLPHTRWYKTASTVLAATLRGEIRLRKAVRDEDLERFASSISNPNIFTESHITAQPVVERGATTCCIGSGHFIFTIRREVLSHVPDAPCDIFLRGEEQWLDQPPDQMGYWRLSTTRAYAYHMGNRPEDWMRDELKTLVEAQSAFRTAAPLPKIRIAWSGRLPFKLRRGISHGIRFVVEREIKRRAMARAERVTGRDMYRPQV